MPEQTEPAGSEQQDAAVRPPSRHRSAQLSEFKTFALSHARLLISGVLFVSGIVLVILGWYGAAHSDQVYAQIPYLISGGLLGAGLIIVSGILASSALQERSADDLRKEVARALASAVRYGPEQPPVPRASNGNSVYVLAGGKSYHEAGCPLIEGKENAKELVPARAATEGFAACKLCGPD